MDQASAAPAGARPWSALWVVAIAQFMVVLDVTVVNVALPSIAAALRFDPSQLQWVVTAYVLVTGGLLLLGGRAADALGRRRIFLSGLAVFTVASLAGALAPSPAALIAARAAQGLGAALLSPAALSILTTSYAGRQRAVALSVWGTIGGAGAAAGVLLGGMLTSWLSWQSVFLVNVPVGVAAGLLALRVIAPTPAEPGARRRLDARGAVMLTAGLVALVAALQGAGADGWGSGRTPVLLALSGALLLGFGVLERRVPGPLVPPRTWRIRSLASSVGLMLGATGVLIAAFFLNSLYLQDVMGASPLEAGLAFLPLALVIGAAAHLGTRLLAHAGARPVVIGGLLAAAAGCALLAAVPASASYPRDLLPGFLLVGAGTGLVFVTVSVAAMADVRHDEAGIASGLMTTAHEIGAALGVAVVSAIATAGATAAGGSAAGYQDGFLAAAGFAVALVAVAALWIPGGRLDLGVAPAAAH